MILWLHFIYDNTQLMSFNKKWLHVLYIHQEYTCSFHNHHEMKTTKNGLYMWMETEIESQYRPSCCEYGLLTIMKL